MGIGFVMSFLYKCLNLDCKYGYQAKTIRKEMILME